MISTNLFGQAPPAGDPLERLRVSYVFAAVMGTGTYKINDRRISMLRVPFVYTQREMTEDEPGVRWHAPVVLGYDALNYEDWLSRLLEDELVTLTLLPGVEVLGRLNDKWILKPFGNVGASYDFTRGETVMMGILGMRALGTWVYEDRSEFRIGASGRYAAEYQIESRNELGFAMFESGVDYRRDSNLKLFARDTNVGVYYQVQLFLPEWGLDKELPNGETVLGLIHEVGLSAGLQESRKLLGISFSRVRAGFKFGDGVRGWSLGAEFPF